MPFIEYKSKKFLYLHVPRTGGGTIESWMETLSPLRFHTIGIPTCLRCTPQHLRMSDFLDLFGEKYFDKVFMTVRNPYDRILSEYKMRAMVEGRGFWQAFSTFSHWLEISLEEAKKDSTLFDNHIRPQWEFIGTGVEPMKFENTIPSIINHMALKMNVPEVIIPRHKHSTVNFDGKVFFDKIDRLRIQEFYRKDFEIFGYNIDDYGSTIDRT